MIGDVLSIGAGGVWSRRHFFMKAANALAAATRPAPRRNVLFISSDDLNHCFSTYGHPVVRTPNLDSIAQRGVRFDRSYCQFPLCSPSRTSMMTGLAPDTTRRLRPADALPRSRSRTSSRWAQAFQKNGYFVARVGKIYHYGNPGQIGTNGLDDEPTWNQRIKPDRRGQDQGRAAAHQLHARTAASAARSASTPPPPRTRSTPTAWWRPRSSA